MYYIIVTTIVLSFITPECHLLPFQVNESLWLSHAHNFIQEGSSPPYVIYTNMLLLLFPELPPVS